MHKPASPFEPIKELVISNDELGENCAEMPFLPFEENWLENILSASDPFTNKPSFRLDKSNASTRITSSKYNLI